MSVSILSALTLSLMHMKKPAYPGLDLHVGDRNDKDGQNQPYQICSILVFRVQTFAYWYRWALSWLSQW